MFFLSALLSLDGLSSSSTCSSLPTDLVSPADSSEGQRKGCQTSIKDVQVRES
ncbi:hypothetical protein Scep_029772 [Stephania cephalantha]|uniref:Uncharacterized protein n=1 Tax=Stephania cephalantha TaxID=152367 RepID=A0AAP0DYJ0_9MAGN